MPVKIQQLKGGGCRVTTPRGVKAKRTSCKKAKAQKRIAEQNAARIRRSYSTFDHRVVSAVEDPQRRIDSETLQQDRACSGTLHSQPPRTKRLLQD